MLYKQEHLSQKSTIEESGLEEQSHSQDPQASFGDFTSAKALLPKMFVPLHTLTFLAWVFTMKKMEPHFWVLFFLQDT